MTVIAHVSDLHFGAHDAAVVAALRAELERSPPDLIAVSGDLTQGARRWEFEAARAFLDSLPAPALAVPGNHDIPPYDLAGRFFDPYARWRAAISRETEPAWRDGAVIVAGLNTARRAGPHWDWSRGRVTPRRLARLLDVLAAAPAGLVRIVVAHHPLIAPPERPGMNLVGGASRALAAFRGAGVSLVLAGHVHRSYAGFGLPDGDGPMIVQASTTTSVRLRGQPNAYNRITVRSGAIAIETRAWTGDGWRATAEQA